MITRTWGAPSNELGGYKFNLVVHCSVCDWGSSAGWDEAMRNALNHVIDDCPGMPIPDRLVEVYALTQDEACCSDNAAGVGSGFWAAVSTLGVRLQDDFREKVTLRENALYDEAQKLYAALEEK